LTSRTQGRVAAYCYRHVNMNRSSFSPSSRARAGLLWALGAAWLGGAVVGGRTLLNYSNTAGLSAAAAEWPRESAIARDGERFSLVMFLHPQCPCSRASVGELERLLASLGTERVRTTVVFVGPAGADEAWSRSSLRERVEAIPGVAVFDDAGGVEAGRFGAHTSGTVLLFGARGSVAFSGGITSARGHEGSNAGSEAVLRLVRGESSGGIASTPVFGCSLLGCDGPEGAP
jgi:hypothetical protein